MIRAAVTFHKKNHCKYSSSQLSYHRICYCQRPTLISCYNIANNSQYSTTGSHIAEQQPQHAQKTTQQQRLKRPLHYYYSQQSQQFHHHNNIHTKASSSTTTNTISANMKHYKNMIYRSAPFLVLTTTAFVLSFRPPTLISCQAENSWGRFFGSSNSNSNTATMTETSSQETQKRTNYHVTDPDHKQNSPEFSSPKDVDNNNKCPYYGCSLRPIDVHYSGSERIKIAMEQLRSERRTKLIASSAIQTLSDHATSESVTLTLIGYKGGPMNEQINQDRSIIISPYKITPESEQEDLSSPSLSNQFRNLNRTMLGVFDGHAPLGELVSEYTATTLPTLLATKLYHKAKEMDTVATTTAKKQQQERIIKKEIDITKEVIEETFVELDRTAPAETSGGCTATMVLQQGEYIYIANAGDSRSFVITYRPSTNRSTVVAISREDKPNLSDEKERVEKMGGQVYIPVRGTSRVVYHDPTTGAPTGLAMSRSIGDWEAGKLGVIPNPLIQVLHIDTIVQQQIYNDTLVSQQLGKSFAEFDPNGDVVTKSSSNGHHNHNDNNIDDVYIFAVCATDGMMDYLSADDIGHVLGHSLYAEDGAHPVAATEHLVFSAANMWHHSKNGRYRDDIAIAVTTLRKPPSSSSTSSTSSTE